MKRFFLLAASIGLTGLLGPPVARAQVDNIVEADVPFAFHAGDTQLPPGRYQLRIPEDSDGSLLEVRSLDQSGTALLLIVGTESKEPAPESELVFHKYANDSYYLWKVVEEGSVSGDEVPATRAEKSLRHELSPDETAAEAHVPAHLSTS